MSKYKTAVIVLAVVVALQIFVLGYLILQNHNLKEAVADAESPPEFKHISENGYFVVYKDGVARDFSGQRNIKLEWYTDGLCPDCTRAHSRAEDFIYEKINNGSMEVKYHLSTSCPNIHLRTILLGQLSGHWELPNMLLSRSNPL